MSSAYAKGQARLSSRSSSSEKRVDCTSHPGAGPGRARVDAMVAAEPRSRRGVGVAYNQVAKGRGDGHLCATASSIRCRDSVLKAFRAVPLRSPAQQQCLLPGLGPRSVPCLERQRQATGERGFGLRPCRWRGHTARPGGTRPHLLQWAECHHTVWIWGEGWIGGGLARGAAFPGPSRT
jgi:hypothetical protein